MEQKDKSEQTSQFQMRTTTALQKMKQQFQKEKETVQQRMASKFSTDSTKEVKPPKYQKEETIKESKKVNEIKERVSEEKIKQKENDTEYPKKEVLSKELKPPKCQKEEKLEESNVIGKKRKTSKRKTVSKELTESGSQKEKKKSKSSQTKSSQLSGYKELLDEENIFEDTIKKIKLKSADFETIRKNMAILMANKHLTEKICVFDLQNSTHEIKLPKSQSKSQSIVNTNYLEHIRDEGKFKKLSGYTYEEFNELYRILEYAISFDYEKKWNLSNNVQFKININKNCYFKEKEIFFILVSYCKSNDSLNQLYDNLDISFVKKNKDIKGKQELSSNNKTDYLSNLIRRSIFSFYSRTKEVFIDMIKKQYDETRIPFVEHSDYRSMIVLGLDYATAAVDGIDQKITRQKYKVESKDGKIKKKLDKSYFSFKHHGDAIKSIHVVDKTGLCIFVHSGIPGGVNDGKAYKDYVQDYVATKGNFILGDTAFRSGKNVISCLSRIEGNNKMIKGVFNNVCLENWKSNEQYYGDFEVFKFGDIWKGNCYLIDKDGNQLEGICECDVIKLKDYTVICENFKCKFGDNENQEYLLKVSNEEMILRIKNDDILEANQFKGVFLDAMISETYNSILSSQRIIVENFFSRLLILFKRSKYTYEWNRDLYPYIHIFMTSLTNYDITKRPLRRNINFIFNIHEYNQINETKLNLRIPPTVQKYLRELFDCSGETFNELLYEEKSDTNKMETEQNEKEKIFQQILNEYAETEFNDNLSKISHEINTNRNFDSTTIDIYSINKHSLSENNNANTLYYLRRTELNLDEIGMTAKYYENEMYSSSINIGDYNINSYFEDDSNCGIICNKVIFSIHHCLNPIVITETDFIELKNDLDELLKIVITKSDIVSQLVAYNQYNTTDIIENKIEKSDISSIIFQIPSTDYISLGNPHYDVVCYLSLLKYGIIHHNIKKVWLEDTNFEQFRKLLDEYLRSRDSFMIPCDTFYCINKMKFDIKQYRLLSKNPFKKLFIPCNVNSNHWILVCIELKEREMDEYEKENDLTNEEIEELYEIELSYSIQNEIETFDPSNYSQSNDFSLTNIQHNFTNINSIKNAFQIMRLQYRRYMKATAYIYDSLNNDVCDESDPFSGYFHEYKGFKRLMDFFNLEKDSIKRVKIHDQPNGYDCGYRTLYNIYQLGLSETFQPLIDPYDDKMFSVFVEILSTTVGIARPRLSNEECLKEFE